MSCESVQYIRKAKHVYQCVFPSCQYDASCQHKFICYVRILEKNITIIKDCHTEIAKKEWEIPISIDETSLDKIFSLMAQGGQRDNSSGNCFPAFYEIFKDFLWSFFHSSDFALTENDIIRDKIKEHPILNGMLRKIEFIRAQEKVLNPSASTPLSAWRDYNKAEREWLEVCCNPKFSFLFTRKVSWFETVENELNNIFFRAASEKGVVVSVSQIKHRKEAIDKIAHFNGEEIVTKNFVKGMECYMRRYNLNAALAVLFQKTLFSNALTRWYYLLNIILWFLIYGYFLLLTLPAFAFYSKNHEHDPHLLQYCGLTLLVVLEIFLIHKRTKKNIDCSSKKSQTHSTQKNNSKKTKIISKDIWGYKPIKKVPIHLFSRIVTTFYGILMFFVFLAFWDTEVFYNWFEYGLWFALVIFLYPFLLGISAFIGSFVNKQSYIGGGQLSFLFLRIGLPRVFLATISAWFLFVITGNGWERVLVPLNPLAAIGLFLLTLTFIMYEINMYIKDIWKTFKRSVLIFFTTLLLSGVIGLFLTGYMAKDMLHRTNTLNVEGNKLNSRYVEQVINCAEVTSKDIDLIHCELKRPKVKRPKLKPKFTLRMHHAFYAFEHISYCNWDGANSHNMKKYFFLLTKEGNNLFPKDTFDQQVPNRCSDIRYLYRTKIFGIEFTILPLFILNYAFIATFIALFFQLIFDNKQITEPL